MSFNRLRNSMILVVLLSLIRVCKQLGVNFSGSASLRRNCSGTFMCYAQGIKNQTCSTYSPSSLSACLTRSDYHLMSSVVLRARGCTQTRRSGQNLFSKAIVVSEFRSFNARFIGPWTSRLRELGWTTHLVIAGDVTAAAHSALEPDVLFVRLKQQRHDACESNLRCKLQLLHFFLRHGCSVVYTSSSSLWLRNPRSFLTQQILSTCEAPNATTDACQLNVPILCAAYPLRSWPNPALMVWMPTPSIISYIKAVIQTSFSDHQSIPLSSLASSPYQCHHPFPLPFMPEQSIGIHPFTSVQIDFAVPSSSFTTRSATVRFVSTKACT
jgi:hypothetical protein